MKNNSCFHCGLDASDKSLPTLSLWDKTRHFCCSGCYAICQTIIQSGLTDYYHQREKYITTQDLNDQLKIIEQCSIYDESSLQAKTVSDKNDFKEVHLILENIQCSACIWLNEKHLKSLQGIIDIEADYTLQRLKVVWDPKLTQLSKIIKSIAEIGYIAHPYQAEFSEQLNQAKQERSIEKIIFAGILGMIVMHFSIASYVLGGFNAMGELPMWQIIGRWTGLLVATAILVWPGSEFFTSAYHDIKNRRLGMNIPIALGLSLAWVGSLNGALLHTQDVYLDSIGMFVFLVLVSRYIELKGRLKAATYLDRLNKVVPESVLKINKTDKKDSSTLIQTSIHQIKIGDHLLIRSGERLPLDAQLMSPQADIDESLITGESRLLHKTKNDALLGGSINQGSEITVKVTHLMADSCTKKITDLAHQGALSKPAIGELSEKVAKHFVFAVLVFTALTSIYHLNAGTHNTLEVIISVLIVTCPCALALAIPVATSLSSGKLVESGILPLRMNNLDALAKIDTIIFDKTGTLTQGNFSLNHSLNLSQQYEDETLLSIAASLEQHSTHPVAQAFKDHTSLKQHQNIQDVKSFQHHGLEAQIDKQTWLIVSAKAFLQQSPLEHPELKESIKHYNEGGENIIVLCVNNTPQMLFILEDKLRSHVKSTLTKLKDESLELIMLSGDRQNSVDRLNSEFEDLFNTALGDHSPLDKLNYLNTLQRQNKHVLMIGDGLNDAPILAQANVSVSFNHAPDSSQAHSDFIISGDDFKNVLTLFKLAKRTRTIIIQNLLWAASYNSLALPAAMAGFVPAWGAAIGMSLSSLIVVINSIRL